jgi:hypothetical protein
MTTEQLNEARNRPWADAEAVASGTSNGPPTVGHRMQPTPSSRSVSRWPRWPAVLLLAGAALAVLVLVRGWQRGQLEVTIERKRSPC